VVNTLLSFSRKDTRARRSRLCKKRTGFHYFLQTFGSLIVHKMQCKCKCSVARMQSALVLNRLAGRSFSLIRHADGLSAKS
jgi:hypothetical protein